MASSCSSRIIIPYPSSIAAPPQRTLKTLSPFPCCCSSDPQPSSPFTETLSLSRYQRESWLYTKPRSPQPPVIDHDADIALQLPELRNLLEVLREKRDGSVGKGPGSVFLVGTGPGDPELLTLKAVRVLQKADLLLYDRLVSNDVLEMVGDEAKLLYVGKTAGYHSRTQVQCC
ncbi:hypothetical protein M569_12457 [Genlisea aurea]|uniref:uroporphyrinogen-III C-methyltransferase n=1 Tax=Genlisea aurea TaxID=192259 RepID=S8CD44_9LAMI|nr:hypothetical protein M569_12457 [Genlisea aurea]